MEFTITSDWNCTVPGLAEIKIRNLLIIMFLQKSAVINGFRFLINDQGGNRYPITGIESQCDGTFPLQAFTIRWEIINSFINPVIRILLGDLKM